jgi:hypothetical protein
LTTILSQNYFVTSYDVDEILLTPPRRANLLKAPLVIYTLPTLDDAEPFTILFALPFDACFANLPFPAIRLMFKNYYIKQLLSSK